MVEGRKPSHAERSRRLTQQQGLAVKSAQSLPHPKCISSPLAVLLLMLNTISNTSDSSSSQRQEITPQGQGSLQRHPLGILAQQP